MYFLFISSETFWIIEQRLMTDSMANFTKLLEQDGSFFEQVLSDPSLDIACKTNSVELRKYLSRHLPRLLKTAFREDNEDITLKALQLLTYGSQFVIPNLVKSSFFPEFACKYISRGNLTERRLGRICDITISIVQSGIKDIISQFGFILTLLREYSGNTNVYNLFSIILTSKDKFDFHRDWLFEIGFEHQLSEMLNEKLHKEYSMVYNIEQESLINLLRLVADACKIPNSRSILNQGSIIDLFSKSYALPPILLNFFWEASNKLYAPEYIQKFTFQIEAAQTILKQKDIDVIHKYHSESLKLLTKVSDVDSSFIAEDLIRCVLNIMLKFNTSSYFLCEARNFFKRVIQIKKLQPILVNIVSPLLLFEADEKTHGLMSMFSYAIIDDINNGKETKKLLKKIPGASNFIQTKLNSYNKKLANEYGQDTNQPILQIIPKKTNVWDTPYPQSQ